MKKLIASLLSVATVASMASMSAFAADATKAVDLTTTAGTASIFVSDKNYTSTEINPDKDIFIDLARIASFVDNDATGNYVAGADLAALFTDGDLFKVKTDKGDDNSKMIEKISVTQKDVDSKESAPVAGRENVIKIELKDDMTDSDYKINPSVTFTAKEDIKSSGEIVVKSGSKYTVELGNFYISNTLKEGDEDWKAGTGGSIAKPTKNDDNEITWEDENDTIARLTFEGDSDVSKYYPKLSTKWDNADYAENFAGTDAFIRSFVGNPTISATSRPVLEFYNPFVNEDGDETVAAEDVVIYEVVDGALVDVTDKFTYGENDDGDSVFTLKTRTLGTYIFSNGAATTPEEEPAVEEPVDGKENPGTGRF